MRQKRAKVYRKLMALYERSFGFRHPYQVLVNADLCETAIQLRMDLVKGIESVLQGSIKPMITQCCIASLYALGRPGQPIVDLAKTFERRRCNHLEKPLSPEECILSVVGPTNKHRYVVATQAAGVRTKLREVPGVPIVSLNRSVMIMEAPSEKTLAKRQSLDEEQLDVPDEEKKTLKPTLEAAKSETQPPPVPRRKKPKGPNPLSVKKKKLKPAPKQTPIPPRPRTDSVQEATPAPDAILGKRKRDDEAEVEAEVGEVTSARKRKRKTKSRKADASLSNGQSVRVSGVSGDDE